MTNAGVQRSESHEPLIQQLNELQAEILSPWDFVRPDAFTFRLGMAYLKTHRPRVMYLAFDETDDWAHDGKYDLLLESYARTDRYLRELWEWIESDAQYRGKTTLIVTTDHGRGNTRADWRSHGKNIEGVQDIWIAFVSPDSPLRGEWRAAEPVFQNQIAATVAASRAEPGRRAASRRAADFGALGRRGTLTGSLAKAIRQRHAGVTKLRLKPPSQNLPRFPRESSLLGGRSAAAN